MPSGGGIEPVLGEKYPTIILYHLLKDGVLRCNEQLRKREADGRIHRKVYPVVPLKTEYSRTERGQTLAPLINAMYDGGRATYIME